MLEVNSTLFFQLKKLKPPRKVLDALRHNKRVIQAELGANGHIDPIKTHLNYSLGGCDNPDEGYQWVKQAIHEYNGCHHASMRNDAVVAIEALFSLPSQRSDIDSRAFFKDCLEWVRKEFRDCPLISSDIHHDEANPHMHVILGCVLSNKLIGSHSIGYKGPFNRRNESFFQIIGKPYGLQRPPKSLTKKDRQRISTDVIRVLQNTNDPAIHSRYFPAIRRAVEDNPINFATEMQIDVSPTIRRPKKMRTSTQIFTSKGKGKPFERSEPLPV